MRYAIVDNTSKAIVTFIMWNGVNPYPFPENTTPVEVGNTYCDIGWIQQPDGSFAPPPEESNG
jgi:hypothetical protein